MKILIVEDEPKIRRGLEKLIGHIEEDANVYTAEDGLDALELLKTIVPDLIFVDIKMPNLNGIDFIAEAREINKSIQFAIVSGYGEFEYAQAAINYNVIAYILKPVQPNKIVEAIEKAKYNISHANKTIENIEELQMKYLDEIIQTPYLEQNKIIENIKKMQLEKAYFILVGTRRVTNENFRKELDSLLIKTCTNTCNYIGTQVENKAVIVFTCDEMSACNKHILQVIKHKDIFRHPQVSEVLTNPEDIKMEIDNLLQGINQEDDKGDTSFIIENVKRHILNHYNEKLTLLDIGKSVYLNPSYISDLFKKKTGENISDYILRIRIEKAKELMSKPEYKIYMVADAVGFTNEKYFSKVFKDTVGLTPNQYRKNSI